MKIIDLLNKIANGEEVPKKIKYNDEIYWYDETDNNEIARYVDIHDEWLFGDAYLNDTVEILEEEPRYINVCGSWLTKSEYDEYLKGEEEKKIPEKLTDILRVDDLIPPVDENMYKIWKQTIKNQNKINEIIDYLKSKGE